jgi:hypothetical protein
MGIMDRGTGKAAAGGGAMARLGETCGCGHGIKLICMSGGECFSYGSYGKVGHKGGLQSISDTHTRTLLGHKTSFLWVENNMWIFGAKKWTADAQNRRITESQLA